MSERPTTTFYDFEGQEITMQVCCHDLLAAFEPGTDYTEYSCAMGFNAAWQLEIGNVTKPVKFCPWCGASVDSFSAQQEPRHE